MTDRLSDTVLEQIARNGRLYSTHEAKLMAAELIERRKKEAEANKP